MENKHTENQLEAIAVIDANGGPTALARKINLPDSTGPMTVNNWKTRGLPWWFKAKHANLIKSAIKKAA